MNWLPKYMAVAKIAERGYALGVRRFPDIPGVVHGLRVAVRMERFGQFTAPSQGDTDEVDEYVDSMIVRSADKATHTF